MLNNYDFNHTENNNEMENETNTYQPLTPSGSHNNNKKNPKNSKKLAKKIGAITLSAVLFGSVAAGSFPKRLIPGGWGVVLHSFGNAS